MSSTSVMEGSEKRLFLSTFDEPSISEIVRHRAGAYSCFSPSRTKQLQSFRVGEERLLQIQNETDQIFRILGYEPKQRLQPKIIEEEIGSLSHEDAMELFDRHHAELADQLAGNFETDLAEAANANLIGEIKWDEGRDGFRPRACTVRYFDKKKERTLTKIRTKVFSHTHKLIDAKKHRFPARSVRKPKRCIEIMNALPPWMAKHSYIVTGTLWNREFQEVARTEVDNELVRGMKAIGHGIRRTASATGRTISRVSDRIREQVLLADPALVVGRVTLFGWLD